MKASPRDLREYLSRHPRAGSAESCHALNGINRSTLTRLAAQLGADVIRLGASRRSRYALRRALRGNTRGLPLYRVDGEGNGQPVGTLDLVYPEGTALTLDEPFRWPLEKGLMQDGWFHGLPYPLLDMRPQGFLGRNFVHQYGRDLAVPENLNHWSDDDVVYVLSTHGHDQAGDLILGDRAYERHLAAGRDWERALIRHADIATAYPTLATQALAQGNAGSSAAGEFPKFTAWVERAGAPTAVIVKFSGAENAPAVRRWADLLVCEHLALHTLESELGIPAARSALCRHEGRTFLEVVRFDRHGGRGRWPVCTLDGLNGTLLGKSGVPWPVIAADMAQNGWLAQAAVERIARIWWFGRLIANTDMHDGNLAFFPGLEPAPVYDMLPMGYAPQRGSEVPPRDYVPPLPLPREASAWQEAAHAAVIFWQRCAEDPRISPEFRKTCRVNGALLDRAL